MSTVRLIFKHFEKFNIKDPFGGWTRRCSPEWGELLYQVAMFMFDVQCLYDAVYVYFYISNP